jgi:3-hydroxy acid dehydrogenase/malonic semialdehyde reductase
MHNEYRGTALVTGASSGIGAAVARELARAGWRMICAARRADRLAELVAELGSQTVAVQLDVTDKISVKTLLERLPGGWRNIDVLVNSAGHDVGGRRRFDEGSMDEWSATIETNTIGTMRVTHLIVPGMIEQGRGHIVNIGSIFGLEAHAGSVAYATSKFAVNGFSKVILDDYRGKGVRVTQILPGVTQTEFSDTRWHGDKAKVDEFYGRFPVVLEAEDVARSVRFAIEQPPHVTISDLVIVPAS